MMNMNAVKLNPEDLEKVVGGTLNWNYYWRHEYEEAGIKVVSHIIAKDEFWWNGENIGHKGANSVVYFTAVKGYAPASLEESIPFWDENHTMRAKNKRI